MIRVGPVPAFPKIFSSGLPIWLCVLCGLLIFAPLLEGGTTHFAAMVIRLLVLWLAAMALVQGLRRGRFVWPGGRVGVAILAFLSTAAASAVLSPYPAQSRQWLLVLCTDAALLYLIVFFLDRWNHVLILVGALAAMGGSEAGLGVVQGLWLGRLRPTGTFFNPNFLAGYLAALATMLFGVVAFCWPKNWSFLEMASRLAERFQGSKPDRSCREAKRIRGRRTLLPRPTGLGADWRWPASMGSLVLAAVLLIGVMGLALIWTGSRGGMLAALAGAGTVLVLRRAWWGMLAGVALIVLVMLLPTPWRDRVLAEHQLNPVTYARVQMWQQAMRIMMDHPFGVGLGLYQYVSPRYAFPVEQQVLRYGQVARTPHSELAQIGAELGVIGLVLFGWGVVEVARRASTALRLRLTRWQRGIVTGAIGSTVSILAHAAVDVNLHEPPIAMLLVLCVAVILVVPRLARREREPEPALPVGRAWLWGAVGGGVLVMLVGIVVMLGLAWLFYETGRRALDRGDLEQAVAYYGRATALDSGKALYHSELGAAFFRLYQATGKRDALKAALSEVRTAIACNPLDGRLQSILGEVAVAVASRKELVPTFEEKRAWLVTAKDAYQEAVRLMPFAVFERLALANVLWVLRERNEAERQVREAIDLEPNFLPGRAWLLRVYLSRRDAQQRAQQEYEEILQRQRRYPLTALAPFERPYFEVDMTALAEALHRAGGKVS